jgi:hypothetical protein
MNQGTMQETGRRCATCTWTLKKETYEEYLARFEIHKAKFTPSIPMEPLNRAKWEESTRSSKLVLGF